MILSQIRLVRFKVSRPNVCVRADQDGLVTMIVSFFMTNLICYKLYSLLSVSIGMQSKFVRRRRLCSMETSNVSASMGYLGQDTREISYLGKSKNPGQLRLKEHFS